MSSGTAMAAAEQQIQRSEKAHGSCWRAAKARRSGTPNGASVTIDLVADAQRAEHRPPFADDFFDGVAVRGAHVGDAGRHVELALGIDEQRLTGRRQVALGRIHDVEHRDVVARRRAERAQRALRPRAGP